MRNRLSKKISEKMPTSDAVEVQTDGIAGFLKNFYSF